MRASPSRPDVKPKTRTQGRRVVEFVQSFCVHPDGDLVDQPLIVHPFWKQRIYELFELQPRQCALCGALETFDEAKQAKRHVGWEDAEGWVCTTCEGILKELPPDIRRYTEALIGIAKKGAKTTMLAGVGLYLLVADNDFAAHGVCAAASEHQSANLLFGSARYMCQPSPQPNLPHPLAEVCEPFQTEIVVRGRPRARLRNVTTAVGTNDGPILKFVMADELHEWKGQRGHDLYTVLSKGLATRLNSLMLSITTAGFDEESICFQRYTYGKRVKSGEIDDPRFYFYWLEAPEGADHRDKTVWAFCNPLLGASVRESYLEDQVNRNPEASFRRYNLNQWTASEEIWLQYGAWDACCQEGIALDPALPLYVGIDMAKTYDSTAVASLQIQEIDGRRRYVIKVRIWENPFSERDPRRAQWHMNNHEVEQLCEELFGQFPVAACEIDKAPMPGPAFCFDPWRFRVEADRLAGNGLAMVEFGQTDSIMIAASQALYEAVVDGQIAHDGDPVLKRHINSVTAEPRERGWRIAKPKTSKKPIDGAVAVALALHKALQGAPAPKGKVGVWWL